MLTSLKSGDYWATYLGSAFLEESIWIRSVRNRAANNGKPVEDHGRFVRVLEQYLVQHIEHDCQSDKGEEARSDDDGQSSLHNLLGQRRRDNFENTHLSDAMQEEI